MSNGSNQTEGGLPFGLPIPGSGAMSGVSLDVIGGKFREAVAWLKSSRERGITAEDMARLLEAAKTAQQGDLDRAVDELRQVGESSNLLERVAVRLRLRKRPKLFGPLLGMLLASRAVERANRAQEKFQRSHGGNVIDRLRSRTPGGRKLGFAGGCDVCGSWMIAGEMRQVGGGSWKLCMACIRNAQEIQEETKKALGDMASTLGRCRTDLAEAVKLDPDSDHARKNLEICDEILAAIKV
jgi:hypothetical protein